MALHWVATTEDAGFGPYAAWEAAVEAAAGGPPRMVPVFVRLSDPGTGMDLAGAISATLDLPGIEFSQHEHDLLETERVFAGLGWPHEVRLVAYLPRAGLDSIPPFWTVLGVGPGFVPARRLTTPQTGRNLAALSGDLPADVPVLAIIDEAIGFLNARFRATPGHSRFLGLWLQALESADPSLPAAEEDIRLGQALRRSDIDAHLAAGGDEAEVYRQVNRALYPSGQRRMTERRAGHGTHVLDIACGAALQGTDPMRQVPILAVQLPPEAVRETAGRRMEAHLVQGLRWILAEVLRQADGTNVPPVVLNLSMGSLAGPGDRTEFLADWMRYELARHARIAPGSQVRIVGAYGNSRLSRLVARSELRISKPVSLDWRVLPDDHTASFLEVRVAGGMTAGLSLNLTPPVGSGLPELAMPWPGGTGGAVLGAGDGPIAAVRFGQETGGQSLLHIALAPTAGFGPVALAPPGLWRVTLASAVTEPLRVIAKVQRDDTPDGHETLGRQSWLDHCEGWTWEDESRAYTAPLAGGAGAACPVSRQGTAVSYAGVDHPAVILVGAVRPAPGQPGRFEPTRYSAEGAEYLRRPGESAGPTLSAPGDHGQVLGGVLAAGILSGSTARFSGTSMAAPAVARRLLQYFLATPASAQSPAAEQAALLPGANWSDPPDRRTGLGVLVQGQAGP